MRVPLAVMSEVSPTADAVVALDRLVVATSTGAIDEICGGHEIELLGVFGSARRRHRDPLQPQPRDLDVAVLFGVEQRLLALVDDLVSLTGYDKIDVAVLNDAGPVLRAEALVGIGLYERERGGWAAAQMAALAERRDTANLRRLDLELLAA